MSILAFTENNPDDMMMCTRYREQEIHHFFQQFLWPVWVPSIRQPLVQPINYIVHPGLVIKHTSQPYFGYYYQQQVPQPYVPHQIFLKYQQTQFAGPCQYKNMKRSDMYILN